MRVNNNKDKTGTARRTKSRKVMVTSVDALTDCVVQDYTEIKEVVVKTIRDNGLFELVDNLLIDVFCRELAIYHTCMQDVESRGVVLSFMNGQQEMEQINPSYKAAKIALDNALKIGKDFGFTTRSRVLLSAHLIEPEVKKDPLAELMALTADVA